MCSVAGRNQHVDKELVVRNTRTGDIEHRSLHGVLTRVLGARRKETGSAKERARLLFLAAGVRAELERP
jgi:hypothetical protein